MNRVRMLEYARDQRDHFTRLHREAVAELPELEEKLAQTKELVDFFDYHKGIQGKVMFLLGQYAETPSTMIMNVGSTKRKIAKWKEEAELWRLTFDGLKALWPDVEVFDKEVHRL